MQRAKSALSACQHAQAQAQSPFSKGGSLSPPFDKGRSGGIFEGFFKQLN